MTPLGSGPRRAATGPQAALAAQTPAAAQGSSEPGGPARAVRLERALRRMNTELTASNRAVAAITSLNETDLAVLDILHQDGPTAPAALARRTRIHPATMTNILARLARDGWVERRPDTTDRRSAQIHPLGTARLTQLYAPANAELLALLESQPTEVVEGVLAFLEQAAPVIHDAAEQLTNPGDASGPAQL